MNCAGCSVSGTIRQRKGEVASAAVQGAREEGKEGRFRFDVHCERFGVVTVDTFSIDSTNIGCQRKVSGQHVVDTGAGDGVRGAGKTENIFVVMKELVLYGRSFQGHSRT